MSRSKYTVYSLFLGLAAITGGFILIWRRKGVERIVPESPLAITRHTLADVRIKAHEVEIASLSAPSATEIPDTRPQPTVFIFLSVGLGITGWTLAQIQLLESRNVIIPTLLYLFGAVSIVPLIRYYRTVWTQTNATADIPPRWMTNQQGENTKGSTPALYWVGAGFFIILSILLAQTGIISPLFAFCWLTSVVLVFAILNNRSVLPGIDFYRTILSQADRYEILSISLLMAISGWMQLQIQTPSPILTSATTLQPFSGLFAVLLIPAAYLLGRGIGGRWTGLFGAGLAAASGWTLALGKLDGASGAAACMAALYLAAVLFAWRRGKRPIYLLAGLLLGTGWLVTPQFVYMALLPPLMVVLTALDSREGWRVILVNTVMLLFIAGIVILPFALAPRPISPAQADVYPNGLSQAAAFLDGVSSSLLMFNLTSDPTPLHGIVNRPVFPPVMGAAFIVGLLGWAAKIEGTRRWWMLWMFAALVVGVLPSAMLIEPPARYPDYFRAAMALPVAICIAGFGLSLIAQALIERVGKVGVAVSCMAFAVILLLVAADSRDHYTNVFLPAYEQAAPFFQNLMGQ